MSEEAANVTDGFEALILIKSEVALDGVYVSEYLIVPQSPLVLSYFVK